MSTLTYAALTTNREIAQPNTSLSTSPPGVKTYVDAFAALVPAEVLALHALIISVTTKTIDQTTIISEINTLVGAFYALITLSIVLYVVPRLIAGNWEWLDYLRASIPPLAFTGWTMLQRTTAFDAAFPDIPHATRIVIALFLGVLLGLAAATLAYKADQNTT